MLSQAELPTSWKGAVYGQAADTIFSDETIIWEKSVAHIDTAKSPRWSRTVIFAVLLLAITATFWAVERAGNNDGGAGGVDKAAAADGETTSGDETKSPLQEYLQFAGAPGSRGADVDQEYIVDGLRKLAGALGTLNLLRRLAESVRADGPLLDQRGNGPRVLPGIGESDPARVSADLIWRPSPPSDRPDGPELERRDDAEIAAGAADSPEQIASLCWVR